MGEIDLRTERGRWALETAQRLIAGRLGGTAYESIFNEELVGEREVDDLLHLIDALAFIGEVLAVLGSDSPLETAREQGRPEEQIEEFLEGREIVRRSPQQLLAFVDEAILEVLGHAES